MKTLLQSLGLFLLLASTAMSQTKDITFAWDENGPPADGQTGVTGYNLYRMEAGSNTKIEQKVATINGISNTTVTVNLPIAVEHKYGLVAFNSAGIESDLSNIVTVAAFVPVPDPDPPVTDPPVIDPPVVTPPVTPPTGDIAKFWFSWDRYPTNNGGYMEPMVYKLYSGTDILKLDEFSYLGSVTNTNKIILDINVEKKRFFAVKVTNGIGLESPFSDAFSVSARPIWEGNVTAALIQN